MFPRGGPQYGTTRNRALRHVAAAGLAGAARRRPPPSSTATTRSSRCGSCSTGSSRRSSCRTPRTPTSRSRGTRPRPAAPARSRRSWIAAARFTATRRFANPADARRWLQQIYRRDRTEGQAVSLYLGVEKAGIVEQLREWFGDLGVPVLALGGYGSQTYVDDVVADVTKTDRPAVLLYAGDHDPSGEDIDRDFTARTDCWDEVRRVALTAEQVEQYALPPQPGKETDSRARGSSRVTVGSSRSSSTRCRPTSCAISTPTRSRSSGTTTPTSRW